MENIPDIISIRGINGRAVMRIFAILLGISFFIFSLALRAEYQWSGAEKVGDDHLEEIPDQIWSDNDCDRVSEAAGIYLYLSGQLVERSDKTDEQKKKAALFKTGVALSQLSVNHAEVYEVFCKK